MLLNKLLIIFLLTSIGAGCATYKSLEVSDPYSLKVYGGTRLDLWALNKSKSCSSRFEIQPPAYPLLDLVPSAIMDTVVLPGVVWMKTFY